VSPRLGGAAAIGCGIGFAVGLPLVAVAASADPVGWRYDDFNRVLTAPLVLLVVALAGLRAVQAERLSRWGRRGASLALGGAVAMLVGNVVEFWLVLASEAEVFAIADPRGLESWVGSTVGWLAFLAGSLVLLFGGVLLGVGTGRASLLPGWTGFFVGLTAPLLLISFVVWQVSVAATVPPAVALGLAWVAIGGALLRYRNSGGTSTAGAASST
jgi:hypothetical protein